MGPVGRQGDTEKTGDEGTDRGWGLDRRGGATKDPVAGQAILREE